MAGHRLRGVLLTTDPGLRDTIQAYSRANPGSLALTLELSLGLAEFSGAQFQAVRQAAPAVVLLDVDQEPELGINLAHDLSLASDDLVLVAIGRELSSELLLRAMRAGVAEYLVKPVTPAGLSDALDRLRPRLSPALESSGSLGRCYAFFSAKGGSGASTAATNVAVELQRITGRRTLLIDLDAELGEISLLLGVQPKFNFVDLVQNFHRMDANLLGSYIEQHPSGVHLLSAPFHPDRASTVSEDQVRQIVMYLKGQYDYVIVDTSKTFSPVTLAAFEQADEVFLIATVDLPSLRNIQRTLPLLERMMPEGKKQLHLVINRYNPNNEITTRDVERSLSLPVFGTLANDYETLIRSVNAGRPAVLSSPRSPYVRDVRQLASRLAGVQVEATSPSGLFKVFRRGKDSSQKGGTSSA
ncbi:MAG TPA: AAA family ATPase [Gemmatimonadales bacterium]